MEMITNWKQLYGKTIASVSFLVNEQDDNDVHMKLGFTDGGYVIIPYSTNKVNTERLLETLLAKHN